jgi:hypothetical protein
MMRACVADARAWMAGCGCCGRSPVLLFESCRGEDVVPVCAACHTALPPWRTCAPHSWGGHQSRRVFRSQRGTLCGRRGADMCVAGRVPRLDARLFGPRRLHRCAARPLQSVLKLEARVCAPGCLMLANPSSVLRAYVARVHVFKSRERLCACSYSVFVFRVVLYAGLRVWSGRAYLWLYATHRRVASLYSSPACAALLLQSCLIGIGLGQRAHAVLPSTLRIPYFIRPRRVYNTLWRRAASLMLSLLPSLFPSNFSPPSFHMPPLFPRLPASNRSLTLANRTRRPPRLARRHLSHCRRLRGRLAAH